MGSYVIRRQIAAPPERVFRAFSEPDLMVDWMDAKEIRHRSGPLDRAGTTFRLVIFRMHSFAVTVIRSEPPRLHEARGIGRLGWYRMVATLTPNNAGTALEILTEYGLPLGPIGRWIDRRWIDREPRAQANSEVDRLVTIVEAGADQPLDGLPAGGSTAGAGTAGAG